MSATLAEGDITRHFEDDESLAVTMDGDAGDGDGDGGDPTDGDSGDGDGDGGDA